MNLTYKDGDITNPEESGFLMIVHCVNDIPAMGSGVAKALMNKWPCVRKEYMAWGKQEKNNIRRFALGEIQVLNVYDHHEGTRADHIDELYVVNLVGQHNVCTINGIPPIRYDAIFEGLLSVREEIAIFNEDTGQKMKLILPRLGASLAGGSWAVIEAIIKQVFAKFDIDITVYTYGEYNE